jgi:hypothetical protein
MANKGTIPRIKPQEREAGHLSISNAEVKSGWSYVSASPYITKRCLMKYMNSTVYRLMMSPCFNAVTCHVIAASQLTLLDEDYIM